MLIIDAHLDLAYSALQCNRDLLYSAFTIRVHECRNRLYSCFIPAYSDTINRYEKEDCYQ